MPRFMSRIETPPGWSRLGRRPWNLCLGIASTVVGLAILFWPRETLRVAAILFAVQLIATGLFRFGVSLMSTQESPGHRVQAAVLSGLAVVVGVFLLGDVDLSMILLTIVLGVYWGVHGIIELVEATTHRDTTEKVWVLASGTMGLVVGVVLLLSVAGPHAHMPSPTASLVLLIRILGVWLAVFGLVYVVRALKGSPALPSAEEASGA